MDKKYHIEPNTVQETLVIPLYGKKVCAETYPRFYSDPSAVEIVESIDYDWSKMKNNLITRFGAVEVGMRGKDLAWEIKDYLKDKPEAAVVNMGAGLDDCFSRVDNGKCRMYNLDFQDVIEIRNELMPPKEREENLAADLLDFSWMDRIDASKGAVFAASGVFYYFKNEDMAKLLSAMAEKFPGGRLCFDTGNLKALKLMLKTYVQGSGMKLDAFFYVEELSDVEKLVPGAKVSARGYMTGYEKLDKSMPGFYRFMGNFGDKSYKLRIIRIEF